MVEQLRNDAERSARFRQQQQSYVDSRRKSVSLLHSPLAGAPAKSLPSPATISHTQESSAETMSSSLASLPSPPA